MIEKTVLLIIIYAGILMGANDLKGQTPKIPRLREVFTPMNTDHHFIPRDRLLSPLNQGMNVRANEVFMRYGIFCRWEAQLQRKERIPIFLRIGDKEYVDKMDGH